VSAGTVELVVDDGVAVATLSRPGKLNSLAGDMRAQLLDAIRAAARDKTVRALIVTGDAGAFCAGGDVATMATLREEGREGDFHDILHSGAECVLALRAFSGLTIAAIPGIAAGAGFSLALACDLRVATTDARFAASWRGLALAPDWGASHWLPQTVGYARALELILSGRVLSADEALDLGLVHRVVAPDALDATLEEFTDWARPRAMVAAVKYLLRKGATGGLEASLAAETEAQEDLFVSADVMEGLRAFRDKRRPVFGEES
jgi:2-(1,2-epoxy-1,2-dihydrophenyl)acetyl-CoA isomerase